MEHFYKHTADYIGDLKSNGKYSFRNEDLGYVLNKSQKNINKDLERLKQKGEIYNVRRGFYLIIIKIWVYCRLNYLLMTS